MTINEIQRGKVVQNNDEDFISRLVSECTSDAFYDSGYVRLDGWYHATEACQDVETSYERRMGKGTFTDDAMIRMLEGRVIDEVIKPRLTKRGYETRLQTVIPTRGHNRIVKVVASPDAYNNEHVLELKTCVSVPKEIWPSYVAQTNFYMHALGIKKGYVVYIPRFGKSRSFPVTYDSRLFSECLDRIEQLDTLLERKKMETG